ncbi:hypothetical protein FCULG_00007978 [Fusarium culmorum]|uniref:SH3 domain-containing protein n=1 Tax=Fusarium culmorum TaxID=5516 RepID=A0A2T4H2P6_FUSCU|nr:hypothetical protein FCULG_00007978 [Fusarium culmorum]
MPPAAPPLPSRFPCWCRAVYSWGGESKRDLGFIEGDLIECLNAGDGSWWVGRLYRDRRTVGSFPSNFVELLPSQFRPTTKSVPTPASNNQSSAPSKSRTFRKPFEAYAKAPHYTSAKQPEVFKETPKPPRNDKTRVPHLPLVFMKTNEAHRLHLRGTTTELLHQLLLTTMAHELHPRRHPCITTIQELPLRHRQCKTITRGLPRQHHPCTIINRGPLRQHHPCITTSREVLRRHHHLIAMAQEDLLLLLQCIILKATLGEARHLPLLSIVQWCPTEEGNNREVTLHHPHPRLLTGK